MQKIKEHSSVHAAGLDWSTRSQTIRLFQVEQLSRDELSAIRLRAETESNKLTIKEPVQTGFRLHGIWMLASNIAVSTDERKEGEVANEISNHETNNLVSKEQIEHRGMKVLT